VHILVYGAGAMGSLIGGLLSSIHDVTLVARQDHVNAIRRCGLRITGKTELVAEPWAMTQVPTTRQDLVIISTKAYDTPSAVSSLERFWDSSLFLTLQNGLTNADVIAKKAKHVVAGTTSHGVTFVREGLIRHAGLGDTYIGSFRGASSTDIIDICDELTACGFPAKYSENIRRDLWMKVIVNSSINPLTATARVKNGRLLQVPQLTALLKASSKEGAAVARSEGFNISDEEALTAVEKVARRTAANRSSMLQDVERGRRTEIEEISGAIVAAARKNSLSVPTTETLALAVAGLQSL